MTDDMVPLDAPEWEGMAAECREDILEALKAVHVQRNGLKRILTIGKGFERLQTEAMMRSHSNQPTGIRYNEAYRRLERPIPELAERNSETNPRGINKTDRNQYIWCWQHRVELEAWWTTKEPHRRDRWNHPDAVKRNYLADLEPRERAAKPKAAGVTVAHDMLARLQTARTARDSGDLFVWTDGPQKIARVLVHDGMAQSSLDKVERVFREGVAEIARLKERGKKMAG